MSAECVCCLWAMTVRCTDSCHESLQRRRTQLLAAQFPEIIKVLQTCAREEFNVEDMLNIAASLSSQYMVQQQ